MHPCALPPESVQLAMPGTVVPSMLQPVPGTASYSPMSWSVNRPPGEQVPEELVYEELSVQTVAPFAAVKQLSLSMSIGTLTLLPLALHLTFFVPACPTPPA